MLPEVVVATVRLGPVIPAREVKAEVKSVSYTHLDVYKRQVIHSGPLTVRAVVEAFCRDVWPETVKRLLMVVEPCLLYTSRCV